jgi:CRP/FNR family transcriptional regulator
VAGRVEAIILRGAEGRAATAKGEVSVPWHHTQADLAAMAGTTRQSVNRVLADLAERGVIRMEPEVLVIRDVARLARDARLASL